MTSNTPLTLTPVAIDAAWIDYNGHLNVAWYIHIFDQAVDEFLSLMGLGEDYVEQQRGSVFALESHITYQRELLEGDTAQVSVQMLDADEKRIHFFMWMTNIASGEIASTMEQLSIFVDMTTRRAAAMPEPAVSNFSKLIADHAGLSSPKEMGRQIAIKNKKGDGANG